MICKLFIEPDEISFAKMIDDKKAKPKERTYKSSRLIAFFVVFTTR